MPPASMETLFNPRGIAIVGVSEKPGSIGALVLRNAVRTGFKGRILAVHPRLDAIDGVRCVSRIGQLPAEIDVAFLALPANIAVGAVEELAAAGIGNVIVGSSGYAEQGDGEGIARERMLAEVAARTNIRVIGPNCNGIYCATHGVSIGFNSGHERKLPAGGLAILSHSGALFDLMARRLETLGGGLSIFVSAGNEVQCDVLDYLDYALADPATRAVALLLDALPSASRFRAQARQARRLGKPIVVLKLGQSELGGAAATAHSSRLVGNAEAYAAYFASCGVPTVATIEGLVTAGVLLDRYGFRSGGMLGVSASGAGAALMADMAARHGIAVPAYGETTLVALRQYQRYNTLLNPMDLGGLTGIADFGAALGHILAEPGIGVFAALMHTMPGAARQKLATAIGDAGAAHDLPLVILAPGGLPEEASADYRRAGAFVLTETDCAFEAMAALVTPAPDASIGSPPARLDLLPHDRMLTESESLALLASFGIKVAETREVSSADEAVRAARAIGYPVALKGVVPGVAHKTELGLVRLNLTNDAATQAAFASLGTMRAIVQAMRHGDIEAMVGVSISKDVGPVLVAGLGGVFVEALRQTVRWALPVVRAAVEHSLDDSVLGRIFASPRWPHPTAREAMIDTIMALQSFALQASEQLEAVEINPLIIGPAGVIAVDGLVIPATLARGAA